MAKSRRNLKNKIKKKEKNALKTIFQTLPYTQKAIKKDYKINSIPCDKKVSIDALLSKEIACTQFEDSYVNEHSDQIVGAGRFGIVRLYKISHLDIIVAGKTITQGVKFYQAELRAHSIINGHHVFPFLYGGLSSGTILMEFIGSKDGNKYVPGKTLHETLGKKILSRSHAYATCRHLVDGMAHMHDKGILHNDLHLSNIVFKESMVPVIIDFGKCTLLSNPLTYNIANTPLKAQYDKNHTHLAWELRNEMGSCQSEMSDIFSLGFVIFQIGRHEDILRIKAIGKRAMAKNKFERPSLMDLKFNLNK